MTERGTGLVPAMVLGGLAGAFVAAAGYTFHFAKATSYLSDDPRSCVNCHVMNAEYDGWSNSPHHAHAACNDCHVPHDSIVHKYFVKAEHGYRHSKRFTFQDFREPIRMNVASRRVVVANCIRCHEAMTRDVRGTIGIDGSPDCIHCHAAVAHGPTR